MNTKLFATGLLAASLGMPVVAFAQSTSEPAGVSTENKSDMKPMRHHHRMHTSHLRMKPGTTTGMNSRSAGKARPGGESVARKPAGE